MDPTLYVDVRCLQDPEYRVRGIGQHVTSLLRTRRHSRASEWKTVALADPRQDLLPTEYAALFDEISGSRVPVCNGSLSVFLDGTPMTHDTRLSLRFIGNPGFVTAAVVYDFIPLDWPGYRETVPSRIYYMAQLARLRNFDVFLPISEYTAGRLSELAGVERHRIHVTGASVRQNLYDIAGEAVACGAVKREEPYFFTVVAADPRKNAEIVVKAVRQLNLLHGHRVRLKVAGHNKKRLKDTLLELAGHAEGQGFLELCFNVTDQELMNLYAGALATIVPSHIEGFSLPVVEATLCRSPVIASTCAAHLELLDQPEALFPSHDTAALVDRLHALLTAPPLRESLIAAQAHLAAKFHEREVGKRFWDGIEAAPVIRFWPRAVRASKKAKPRLAFLSPCPPDPSQAAFYTAMTMQSGAPFFESTVYTDTPRPLALNAAGRDAGPISIAALLDNRHNAIVSVLGSFASPQALAFFERYGGACILHDLRLVDAYRRKLSHPDLLGLASVVLNRPASGDDLALPFRGVEDSLLLAEPVAQQAAPLIVQTKRQQEILKLRCNADAQVATCCPSLVLSDSERSSAFRAAARVRLGISPRTFVVAAFGTPCAANSHETTVIALDFLRSWKVPADLYFANDPKDQRTHIHNLSDVFGVLGHVHCPAETDNLPLYRDLLAAADVALQLRPYDFGSPSTDLCNAISSGVPCVTTNDMAAASDAPGYVFRVPDYFSPLQVAEQLIAARETSIERAAIEEERIDYTCIHNFSHYAARLLTILGLA